MSVFLAIALALATSVAIRVMRRISSSVTIGLLAKPHVPLWMTRTPKPAAPTRPPPPRPPRPLPPPPPRPPPPPPPAPPASPPAPAAAAESAEVIFAARYRVAAGGVDAAVGRSREADVGVAAPAGLRLLQRDVGKSLELRVHHAPRRGLREEVG